MSLSILAVSSETGIAKEVLRKWETRYGFPVPERDQAGNRVYSPAQLERLKLIKKLIDAGMRPGQLVPLGAAALAALNSGSAGPSSQEPSSPLIATLQQKDPAILDDYLRAQLARLGLAAFVLDLMPAMNAEVGEAWASGTIAVRDEHLYSEVVQRLVHEALSRQAGPKGAPPVLLTTPQGELHTLGLLMTEAVLSLNGADCISLGAQSPTAEIVLAAREYDARIVGLSFSACFPKRKIYSLLKELRAQLPPYVELWAGGAGAAAAERMPRGVMLLASGAAAAAALEKHRRRAPPQT